MKNKKLATRLLSRDCEITCRYLSGNKTCAVGCLALASGVSRYMLRKFNDRSIAEHDTEPLKVKIWDKFAIPESALRRIQWANDNYGTVEERRRAVLEVLQELP